MRDVHAALLRARHDLENHSIEGSSTAQAVTFITFVQDLKKKVVKWAPEMAIFATGQQTLERQRYQFPSEWLYVDRVQGEWGAFNEILKRKNDSIQQQLGSSFHLSGSSFTSGYCSRFQCLILLFIFFFTAGLQMKIVAEDKIVDNKINDLVSEWEANKFVLAFLLGPESAASGGDELIHFFSLLSDRSKGASRPTPR
jgi:dynein heavy chain 1